MWIYSVFLAWGLVEIALFVLVGGWIGVWPVLGIVLLTAVLGGLVIRGQGLAMLRDMQRGPRGGMVPMAHGGLRVLGGALLIMPGLLCDALGVLLLLPPVRSLLISALGNRFGGTTLHTTSSTRWGPDWAEESAAPYRGDVVDGEFTEIPPESPQIRPPSGWTRH